MNPNMENAWNCNWTGQTSEQLLKWNSAKVVPPGQWSHQLLNAMFGVACHGVTSSKKKGKIGVVVKRFPSCTAFWQQKKGCKIWEAQRWNDPVKFHLGGLRMLRILLALQFLWNLSGAIKRTSQMGFPHMARSNSPTSEEFSSSIQKWPGNKACDAWQMRDARRRGTKSTFNPNSNAAFRYSYIVEDCWSQNSPGTVADRLTPYPLTLVTSCNFLFSKADERA